MTGHGSPKSIRREAHNRADLLLLALPPFREDAPHQKMPGEGRHRLLDRSKQSVRNTKIIYFCRQNAYLAQTKRLFCTKMGAGAVQFLVGHFTFLGFEGQNWMLIATGLIAAFIFFVWKTRDRS